MNEDSSLLIQEGLDHEEIHYLEMALERARRYEQFKSEDLKLHQLLPNAGYMSSQVWRSPRKIPTPKLVVSSSIWETSE